MIIFFSNDFLHYWYSSSVSLCFQMVLGKVRGLPQESHSSDSFLDLKLSNNLTFRLQEEESPYDWILAFILLAANDHSLKRVCTRTRLRFLCIFRLVTKNHNKSISSFLGNARWYFVLDYQTKIMFPVTTALRIYPFNKGYGFMGGVPWYTTPLLTRWN